MLDKDLDVHGSTVDKGPGAEIVVVWIEGDMFICDIIFFYKNFEMKLFFHN